ncbi:acyltransferase family protein [Vibrio sp. NTOU-M3]|uniref:acyltransferase family protein n=1 Tax=Vibrio sp. NTOU-M3 TaxID=3234954 RepID=UPI00349F7C00
MVKSRDLTIDSLRGFACLLVVVYHVIGNVPSNGLRIEDGLIRDFNNTINYIHMPLFTLLSGIVYDFRPFSGGFGAFVKDKFLRLLVPMFIVGTFFAVVQFLMPGTSSGEYNWQLLHILPVGHFWYLESIFTVFIIVAIVEFLGLLKKVGLFSIVFCLSILASVLSFGSKYFAIDSAFYLLPFFLIGIAIHRFELLKNVNSIIGLVFIVTACVGYYFFEIEGRNSLSGLAFSIVISIGFLALRIENKILAKVGFYSYTIYLFHVFFTSAARMVGNKLGIDDLTISILCGMFAGVCGPILVELICDGTNLTRKLCLGKRKTTIDRLWLSSRFAR